MKKFLNYFILGLVINFSYAQKKELFIVDKTTKLAIEDVNISILNSSESTFTNSEGKASINLKENFDLKISNIGYEEVIISYKDLKSIETIFLVQKVNILDEVVIKSFNLNKALQFVSDNFSSLYVNVPFEKECDFKEIVEVNGKLKRLILSKVNWWDKTYERKFEYIKLRLGKVEYFKNEPFDIFYDLPKSNVPSNSGFINPESVINTLYLNILLQILMPALKEAKTNVEDSPKETIKVSFETDWKKIKSDGSMLIKGFVIFDKLSKAILEMNYRVDYKNNIDKQVSPINKKESVNDTKQSSIIVKFDKSLEDKLSLKFYESKVNAEILYDNKISTAFFENKIYVLNEIKVKKVNNQGLIDLKKPIFQSLPSNEIKSSNSILLDSKEKEFIFGNN